MSYLQLTFSSQTAPKIPQRRPFLHLPAIDLESLSAGSSTNLHYTEFWFNHIKQLTLSSIRFSVLPIFFRQTCLSTVTSITSSCIANTCPCKSVFRCFSSYKVSNRNNNARTRRDCVVLNKRDNVRTCMAKHGFVLNHYTCHSC